MSSFAAQQGTATSQDGTAGSSRAARRLRRLGVALGIAFAALPVTSALAAGPPNLRMAKLRDIQIQKQSNGAVWLRYTTIMVNVGAGPFEVTGTNLQGTPTVTQNIYNADGSVSHIHTSATMFYAGDGHNHWHVRDMETGQLSGNGQKPRALMKTGYCFSDDYRFNLSLPGAPPYTVYTSCGANDPTASTVTMGLSVGWGDVYSWSIAFQDIDITNLPDGHYTLTGCANSNLGVVESNYTDNCATQDLQLKGHGTSVKLVGQPTGA